MVATLVKLKWRLTLNALTKNVWAIIGTVIGALYGLGALVMVLTGAVGLGLKADPDVIMLVLGALGALLLDCGGLFLFGALLCAACGGSSEP